MAILGHLTEDERVLTDSVRMRSQSNMQRLGELNYQVFKLRQQQAFLEQQVTDLRGKESLAIQEQEKLCQELDTVEFEVRAMIERINQRLAIDPSVKWVAQTDGTIQTSEE